MITKQKYQDIITKAYNLVINEEPNAESLKMFGSRIAEHEIAKLCNGSVESAKHYDVYVNKKTTLSNGITLEKGDRIEVKAQFFTTNDECVAYSLASKEGKCDYIALYDYTGDSPIISIIPSFLFFEQGDFIGESKKDRFRWCGNYSVNAGTQKGNNTEMFLNHQITI